MEDVKDRVFEKIKIVNSKRYLSNCYTLDVVNKSNNFWSIDDEFMFSYEDHGIDRLIFFVKEWNLIDKLLMLIDGGKYYLEYVIKSSLYYDIKNAERIARLIRVSNADCNSVFANDSEVLKYKNSASVERAQVLDTSSINRILWSTFHTEVSHLLYDDELKEKIENGDITIHRDSSCEIDALLQAEVLPKKFYINQVVNKTDKNVIHAILLNRLEEYISNGGKYLYSWVEDNNTASMKFHKKYGMEEDGTFNMIYCIER